MKNASQPAAEAGKRLFTFRFRAMNTGIACTVPCASEKEREQLKQDAISWFRYIEERFSRFRPTSELVHLNERAGADCLVSSAMLEVLQLAETYRNLTDGVFDPFILRALERCGYNRSFEQLAAREEPEAYAEPTPASYPLFPGNIRINPYMQSVKLPKGTSIDLGGIVKSWAVKRLADWLRRKRGAACGIVNAGGDLAVWGRGALTRSTGHAVGEIAFGPNAARASGQARSAAADRAAGYTSGEIAFGPNAAHASGQARSAAADLAAGHAAGETAAGQVRDTAAASGAADGNAVPSGAAGPDGPWRIAIEHPWEAGRDIGLLLLGEGASATSGTLGRRWETARGAMHHLIDPATMAPSESNVVQCTTAGADPVACEIWAKTLCILGTEAGIALLARTKAPVEALLFTRDRELMFYGDPVSLGSRWIGLPAAPVVVPAASH